MLYYSKTNTPANYGNLGVPAKGVPGLEHGRLDTQFLLSVERKAKMSARALEEVLFE